MSREEAPAGLAVMEKFFGIITIIVGVLTIYYTFTSLGELSVDGAYPGIFAVMGFILIVTGVALLLAKTEE